MRGVQQKLNEANDLSHRLWNEIMSSNNPWTIVDCLRFQLHSLDGRGVTEETTLTFVSFSATAGFPAPPVFQQPTQKTRWKTKDCNERCNQLEMSRRQSTLAKTFSHRARATTQTLTMENEIRGGSGRVKWQTKEGKFHVKMDDLEGVTTWK